MSDPVRPAPAATLILLRDRPGGDLETLLIQRHARSRFAAGDHVFPGGRVEEQEAAGGVAERCRGLTPGAAAARLGGLAPAAALGHWVGAIREAFEEVGILLAYGPDGAWLDGAGARERLATHRAACQGEPRAFGAMLATEGLTLATDRMAYVAHWITPEESPIRFDTRFFAAEAPPGQEPEIDGHEIVASRWLPPAEALAAGRRGELTLRLPTVKNLELLAGAPGGAAAAVAALGAREVPTIRPRIITVDGRPRPVIPPDPRWY